MVQINFALREVSCKIVYYGPGLSGKTTNLEIVHQKAPAGHKGKMTSLATEGDRTLFFDFLPLDLGTIGGMKTKFQLYTVPGQVYYNATRKLVLRGADGVIFVADSDASKLEENIESLENLEQNLKENGLNINEMPLVLQWNKRDLPNALSVAELEQKLNRWGAPSFEAVAVKGEGVFPTLKALAGLVLESVNTKGAQVSKDGDKKKAAAPTPAQARPAAAPPPVAPQPPAAPPMPPPMPPMPQPPMATPMQPPMAPPMPPASPPMAAPPRPQAPAAPAPRPGPMPAAFPAATATSAPPRAPAPYAPPGPTPYAAPYPGPAPGPSPFGAQPPLAPASWQPPMKKQGVNWANMAFIMAVVVILVVIGYLLFFYQQ
ncbi:MAG: ADP-ribosylation factor-like protein [Planctomycetota bacterium]